MKLEWLRTHTQYSVHFNLNASVPVTIDYVQNDTIFHFKHVCILAIITMFLSSFFPQDNRGEQSFKFELVFSKELVLQMHLTTFIHFEWMSAQWEA